MCEDAVGRTPRLQVEHERVQLLCAKSVCSCRDRMRVLGFCSGGDAGAVKASSMNDAEAGTSGGAVTEDFDVFLNHRGPDVKATFVAHLEDALRCVGYHPFLDARSLMKGNPALESIDQALDMAEVHVAVVSRGYAESKYCLNELVAMMRSGKPVVPVFYGVEPGELRRVEDGPFAEAFEKHERRGRTEKEMQEWRDALCALAGLTGFRLADYKSDEAKLKQELVKEVARLTPSNQPIEVASYIVGLKGPTKSCVELLKNMGDEVGILGLVGMGGVGKTTLAREIYNHYAAQRKFKCMTFLEVLKSPSSSNVQVRPMSCNNLREQLLWDLFRVHDCTSNYGSWFQKVALLGPVLIVIDDVHKLGQFEALIPSASFLHPGSRIIITSRDCNILNNAMGRSKVHCQAYHVVTLASVEANILFNWHAFNVEEAPKDYKDVAMDIVKACGGLPLALKVMGCHLYDKRLDGDKETIWVEAINMLKRSKDIMDVLRWSYDSLEESDKLMFLDITCMFYDKTVEEAMACWKGCKDTCGDLCMLHTSLRNLMDKSLVVVQGTSNRHIRLHDLLRDLGHEIATKTKRHCLDHKQLEWARMEKQVSMDTIGVNLEGSRKRKFKVTSFASMPNLHYLRLSDGCHVNGNLNSMPKKMRFLQWRGMPMASIPLELNMKYMVSLDFLESPNLDFMWTDSSNSLKVCRSLLKLNLSGCKSIAKLPNSIGHLPRLKNLNLNDCIKLKKLPDSLGQLKELEELKLMGCYSLEALPESIANLNLHTLGLTGCKSISKLPDSIGQLTALHELLLRNCTSLEGLPDTMGALSNLTYLDTEMCKSIVKIPTSIGLLSNLKTLLLDGGATYPQFIDGHIGGEWTQLKTLSLQNWGGIGSHLDYGALQSLNHLNLHDSIITKLPNSIGLLVHLSYITISCERLQSLPKSIGDLKMLKTLNLVACSNLRRLPKALGALTRLEELYIHRCCNIKKLPKSVGLLSNLLHLSLEQCKNLQELPTSIRQLKSLKSIRIGDCGGIEAMGALTALQGHPLWGCTSITNLPTSFGTISNLDVCDSKSIPWYVHHLNSFDGKYLTLEEDKSGFLRAYPSHESTRLLRCTYKESTLLKWKD